MERNRKTPELVVNSETVLGSIIKRSRVPNQNEIALGTVWNNCKQTGLEGVLQVVLTGSRFRKVRQLDKD